MHQAFPFVLAAAVALGLGCSHGAGTAGLANAPGGTRPWGHDDHGRDAVANGPGSCPESGKPDPFPGRIPPCAEASAKPPRATPPASRTSR
ncbi:MAG: hypothetical protein MUF64_20450 [Polyangiaceae bacterium]|jgi:hypothetical protein|nr:hypothetical protein [Polyangiaceae bacterium]